MMTLPRTVADVLSDHVTFEVECIDRMYLNVWVPRLAYGGGVAGFFVGHRGNRYAPTALMDPMSKAFVADIHDFIATRGLEVVGFPAAEGVLYVGRAQEKSGVWRTQRRHNPATGGSYAWLVRATAFINFFYFYCVDADFGPFFIKFSTYFPFTAKICINGNEWAKRQAAKAGIGFEALDNGFAAVDDVDRLQAICDSRGPGHIEALLRKWLKILPNPFTTADEAAGYRYELSVLQAEFSLTGDARPTGVRANLLRAGAAREPRHWPPRPDWPGLRPAHHPQGPPPDPGPLPHPGHHRRRRPVPAHRLQELQDQAVPQVATRGRTLRVDSQAGGPTDVGGVVPGRCSMARARSDVRCR